MIQAPSSQGTAGVRKKRLLIYLAAVFLYWMSLYLYASTLPVYVESKTGDLALVGTVLAMYGLWQMLVRLPVGIAADWLGKRKPFIIAGFLMSVISGLMMGYAPSFPLLAGGRAVSGLAAATWVPLVVTFSSLFPPEDAVRATAMLTVAGSASRMLSTALTGTLNDLGGYSLAFILAAAAAGLAILVILPDREKTHPPKRPSAGLVLQTISRSDVLIPSLLAAVAQYATWSSTFGFIPILAEQLGASNVLQSMLMSTNIAVVLAGNLATTALVRRIGSRTMLFASFFLLSGGLLLASLAHNLGMLFAAQVCTGMAAGVGGPILMGKSIEKVEDEQRTTAMGLHQSVYAIGMFTGPSLSGVLANHFGIQSMFAGTAVFCLVLGLVGLRLLKAFSKPLPAVRAD
jgi:MFS family permease